MSNSVVATTGLERPTSLSKPVTSLRLTGANNIPSDFSSQHRRLVVSLNVGPVGSVLKGPSSDTMAPYSPPASSLSPASIASANEGGGKLFRGTNRKHTVTK